MFSWDKCSRYINAGARKIILLLNWANSYVPDIDKRLLYKNPSTFAENSTNTKTDQNIPKGKNSAYGRHWISQRVLIVAQIPNKTASLIQKLLNYQATRIEVIPFKSYQIHKLSSYQVTKLPNYQITKLPSYQVTKLTRYQVTKLSIYQVTKFNIGRSLGSVKLQNKKKITT